RLQSASPKIHQSSRRSEKINTARDNPYLGTTTGSAYYDAATDLTNAWDTSAGHKRFDPVAAGWTLVPEPSTALLVGLGLVALGLQRRHRGNPPHRL
ncbi:MAG: hypothetical protein CMJ84_17620, partial [Planctomycetes bacterium]|nr:hypothetical protein [Planctomycetota bacterium]